MVPKNLCAFRNGIFELLCSTTARCRVNRDWELRIDGKALIQVLLNALSVHFLGVIIGVKIGIKISHRLLQGGATGEQ